MNTATDSVQTRIDAENACKNGCKCSKQMPTTSLTTTLITPTDLPLCGLCTTDPDDNLLNDEPKPNNDWPLLRRLD